MCEYQTGLSCAGRRVVVVNVSFLCSNLILSDLVLTDLVLIALVALATRARGAPGLRPAGRARRARRARGALQ